MKAIPKIQPEANENCMRLLEHATYIAESEGVTGIAVAFVNMNGTVGTGLYVGDNYFPLMGALSDLQLDIREATKGEVG